MTKFEFNLDETKWQARASCKDMGPDLFFPVGTTGPAIEQSIAAKAICESCRVTDECLDYALNNQIKEGIWGGATEEERKTFLQIRRNPKQSTA